MSGQKKTQEQIPLPGTLTLEEVKKMEELAKSNPTIAKLLNFYTAVKQDPESFWDAIVLTAMETLRRSITATSLNLKSDYESSLFEIVKTKVGGRKIKKVDKPEENGTTVDGEEDDNEGEFKGPVLTAETLEPNKKKNV